MEYITHDDLEQFSAYLTDLVIGSCRLNAKIEAFTSRYRKPTRIGRSRSGKKGGTGDIKLEESIPSYLTTGIIHDGQSHPLDYAMTSSSPNDVSSLFTQSLSNTDPHCITPSSISSAITLPIPRRQRSFSLTSCYSMRKPTRRRTSSLGDLNEPSSRVLFMDMISALNEAFPDYDFGDSKKEQFREQELPIALRLINGYFAELSLREPDLLEKLWAAIDGIVNLKNCEIFQYEPTEDDDADNYLWCFHYFFFNKELHTLCYFNCSADSVLRRKLNSIQESDNDEDDDMMDCDRDCSGYREEEEEDDDEEEDFGAIRMNDGDFDREDDDNDNDENRPDWDGVI